MKKIFLYLPIILLLGSCVQKEPLNAEADIEECEIMNGTTGKKEAYIVGNVSKNNYNINAQANPKINLSDLFLKVKLTEGATITPDPTVVKDYSTPREFVVTSQDGQWHKTYTVSIDTLKLPTEYHFENYELNEAQKYQLFYNTSEEQNTIFKQYIWASGNAGYSLTGVARTPEDYPTVSIPAGKSGKGVKLETKSTGGFGAMAKMPIAAGNLFIGSFDVTNAMSNALKATLFGLPFTQKPISFSGHYKYKRGSQYTIVGPDGYPLPADGKDLCDIYAVLYESAGLEKNSLNGKDVLDSDHIIAMARLSNPVVHSAGTDLLSVDYENFDIKFDYDTYRAKRPFDISKARNYEYSLAVVFTSSIDGANFNGAIGSTLWIDEVKVICE